MSNASVAEFTSRSTLTEEHSSGTCPESKACITIIDRPVAPPRELKGDPITGKVSLLRLAGVEFGRIHELDTLRVHDGRLYGFSAECVPMGSIVTLGWQDPSRVACRGVVAFAFPESGGWRITVEIDSKLAA
jgi:hypothetical protein